MAVQLQMRRGTTAEWTAADPTLANGEWGLDTTTSEYYIGNGSTAWTSLTAASLPSTAISTTVVDAVGDIFIGTADNTAGRLAVGTNDYVLTADSSVSNVGLAWKVTGTPTTITVADTTDTTCFVGLWESATGDIGPKSDAGVTYNAGTGVLTATGFAGPLTGLASSATTAATVTTAAQSAITSTGTLTGVTVSGTGTIGVAVGQAVDFERKTNISYTLILIDAGKVIEMNSGTPETVTIPPNSSVAFPIGTQIVIVRLGAGAVTIVEGSGVTTRSDDDKAKIKSQYSSCVLIKHETDEWYILGNLDS